MYFSNALRVIAIKTAFTATLALTACAVAEPTPGVRAQVDDTTITTQVKARFLNNSAVDGRVIHVKTRDGTVLLTGTAANHVEKATATEIALGVAGVRMVQNEIIVAQ